MRIVLVIPLLLVSACNVSTDANNDSMTVQYNEETAENAAADIGNAAENIGSAIGNEAEKIGNDDSADEQPANNTVNQQ